MDSPLLSPRIETCGTSEAPSTKFALPPDPEPRSTGCWMVTVDRNLDCMPSDEQRYLKNPCIYRLPAFITKLNSDAYQPHVVSFGPYHHGEDHLVPMEEHKHRACDRFLERSGKSLEPFFESLRDAARDLKESYDALNGKWKEDRGDHFLELMIRDGCFMLEIMRATTAEKEKNDYAPNDPIFSTHRLAYITPYIRRDMLMLENQLPMLVLYQLVAVESNGEERDEYINKTNNLVLSFYSLDTSITGMGRCLHVADVFRKGRLREPQKVQHKKINVGPEAGEVIIFSRDHVYGRYFSFFSTKQVVSTRQQSRTQCAGFTATTQGDKSSLDTCIPGMGHVVDVFRKCLPKKTKEVQHGIIRSATELKETGIQFQKSLTRSLKDISFARGVLKLPAIMVDDTTKSELLNLMTFERLHIGTGNEITSYTKFMDNIINNERDVALLHAQGIIQNSIGCDDAVADLFNSLCKEVTVGPNSSLDAVQKKISEYCEKPWNRWRANLRHTYFGSPWSALSLIAAIFLFALTIIQTIFIVLTYY
ncbi:hypothetical protein ACJRO7_004647 [Eucalyptus globulus]|uniref:Uncharacterized protein n=1 Tax=Eucalyptus globulus TaxID=34317 RepID=A0ABD3IXQ4_EUCGL